MYGSVLYCQTRGFHVVHGAGCGTSDSTLMWGTHCADCSTPLRRTEEGKGT